MGEVFWEIRAVLSCKQKCFETLKMHQIRFSSCPLIELTALPRPVFRLGKDNTLFPFPSPHSLDAYRTSLSPAAPHLELGWGDLLQGLGGDRRRYCVYSVVYMKQQSRILVFRYPCFSPPLRCICCVMIGVRNTCCILYRPRHYTC